MRRNGILHGLFAVLAAVVLLSAAPGCRRGAILRRPATPVPAISTAVPSQTPGSLPSLYTPPPSDGPPPATQNQNGGVGSQGGSGNGGGSGGSGGGNSTAALPAEFPVPAGDHVVSTASTKNSVAEWFAGPQASTSLASFFQTQLPGRGWRILSVASAKGPVRTATVYTISGFGWRGNVAIGEGYPAAAGYEGVFSFYVHLQR